MTDRRLRLIGKLGENPWCDSGLEGLPLLKGRCMLRLKTSEKKVSRNHKAQAGQAEERHVDSETIGENSGHEVNGGAGEHLDVGDEAESVNLITSGCVRPDQCLEGGEYNKKSPPE